MQIILGGITSAILVLVTAYFGVRGDVRARAAVKELIELYEALPAGAQETQGAQGAQEDQKTARDQLKDEIDRRIRAFAPTPAEITDEKAKRGQRWKIGFLIGPGVALYVGVLFVTGIEGAVSSWLVALVFVALPLAALLICAGAISWLRYWRRYHPAL